MLDNYDLSQVLFHLYQIGIAFILALPIALNRERGERSKRSAGLRTFPLVSIATCGYMLVGIQVLENTDAESRVFYGLVTGMGFIGGGAILKDKGSIRGTATAASIWNTGAIGISVAFQRYEIATVLSILNFLTLQFMPYFKQKDNHHSS